MTVHQYLREFEACYAHILDYEERDKIFRFLFGLRPEWRAKFQLNPAIGSMWQSFDALVAYISSYIADDGPLTLSTVPSAE